MKEKKKSTRGSCKAYSTDQSVSEQHDARISFRARLVQKSYIHTCSTQVTAPGLSCCLARAGRRGASKDEQIVLPFGVMSIISFIGLFCKRDL